jgi:RNA polymerase sigma-70 factor (ECF subfamily)
MEREEETERGTPSGEHGRGVVPQVDEATFRAFYERHAGEVLHFLRAQLRNDMDRADVTSRTFETAYRHLHELHLPAGKAPHRAERNWLFTIARNQASAWRRKNPEPERLHEDSIEARGNPEQELACKLAYELLRTLRERDRIIYLLHHRQGYTHNEIAEALSLPLGTVKTSLARAQAELDARVDRLCKREGLQRGDYLRGLLLPLPSLFRNMVEDMDPAVGEIIWDAIDRGSFVPAPVPRAVIGTAGGLAGAKLVGVAVVSAVAGALAFALLSPQAPAPALLVGSAEAAPDKRAVVAPADRATATVTTAAAPPGMEASRPSARSDSEFVYVPAAATTSVPPTASMPATATASEPVSATASASVAASGAPTEPFGTESDVMQAARNAFASGDFSRALRLADEHLKRYPGGQFVAEREAIAIRGLAQLGRLGEARKRAEGFRRTFPNSLFRSAIDTVTGAPSQ